LIWTVSFFWKLAIIPLRVDESEKEKG